MAAADELALRAPHRYCTLIVVDGELVLERYHANTSLSLYESDSMGKTAIAALIGVAVTKGLLDIDLPIHTLGVKDSEIWNATGVSFFKQVTTRHILSQATVRWPALACHSCSTSNSTRLLVGVWACSPGKFLYLLVERLGTNSLCRATSCHSRGSASVGHTRVR